MKVIGVTLAQLLEIAEATQVRVANTGAWNNRRAPYQHMHRDGRPETRFTLRTLYSEKRRPVPYRRTVTPWPGRKTRTLGGPLCWHGHRDFMIELFRRFPSAVLESAFAKYDGREGFERGFEGTGYQNIGSQAYPRYFREACYCEAEGYDDKGMPDKQAA